MNPKIYQLFFKDEHIPLLDPLFVPFDNRQNLKPLEREYPLLKKCYDISVKNGDELWGGFTWRFNEHFSSGSPIDSKIFFDHIKNNPGYDVYFFNAFTSHVPVIFNVWEQGQWCHPHMLTIMQEVFPLLGLSSDVFKQAQTRDSIFWGSLAVGNRNFWDNYFTFVDKYYLNVGRLSSYVRQLHDNSAMYTDSAVEYFPFIQERLMSTFIHLSSLKAMPFHINENTMPYELQRLNSLKATNQLEQWLDLRQEIRKQMYPKSIDWAKTWINERNKSYVL